MSVNELRITMEICQWRNVKYGHKIRVEVATAVITHLIQAIPLWCNNNCNLLLL